MSLLRRSHEICAVDLLRLAGFHQPVCLSLFLLFLGAAINLGTLAQAAAGTRVVTYPPHLHSEARRKRRFHFLTRVYPFGALLSIIGRCGKTNFLIWGVVTQL